MCETPATEIQESFRGLATCIGGICHVHKVNDEVVWALSRAVSNAYKKSVQAVVESPDETQRRNGGKELGHPAITALITNIENTTFN